ncbi:MAG: hypothetical protein WA705_22460 [Candidatus Ozemobacteraceae bacterium]
MSLFRMRRLGFVLLEALVVVTLLAVFLGMAMKIFLNSSQLSEKINDQQMIDNESQRLLTFLRADCRSAHDIQANGEALSIIRFNFENNDASKEVRPTKVTYVFCNGNIVREENGNMKTFEFKKWQKKSSDLECVFALASPAVLCFKLSAKNTNHSLIDERVVYETIAK